MKITVIGCGHLGATHAAGMAEIGHHVVGIDVDQAKVDSLNEGRSWFHEEGLDELLQSNIEAGRLRFSTDFAEAAAHGEVHFLAVGTPVSPAGGYDLSQLHNTIEQLAPHLTGECLIVGKSTVAPGTAHALQRLAAELAPSGDLVEIAWNPEFLREGTSVADTLTPDRIVLGVTSEKAKATLLDLYDPIVSGHGCPVILTDPATAEMAKATANAYLATRISFINAVAEMCAGAGANVSELADAIGHDARIGRSYLSPGLGFGGGCIPKDLRAFVHQAEQYEVSVAADFFRSIDSVNLHMRRRAMDLVLEQLGGQVAGKRVAVLGVAFKPGVDDIRDSPAMDIAVHLHKAGADVTVYDPKSTGVAQETFPKLGYAVHAIRAVEGADLVFVGTAWPEFGDLDPDEMARHAADRRIIDARGVIDSGRWRAAGWTVLHLGVRA
ncbi:UDP-glucose dehydrogenase family protein [Nonomuraea sp. NPDC050328]|uniref:UDP-glucose dehydrogenase family protein n=1 Tax=Nonomuraea sp. NPDC050328 TaxID=3364361 RepID=UPI00378EDB31